MIGTVDELSEVAVKNAIKFSHIVILLYDIHTPLSEVDLKLARSIIDEGRGLIIVGNKMDSVENK